MTHFAETPREATELAPIFGCFAESRWRRQRQTLNRWSRTAGSGQSAAECRAGGDLPLLFHKANNPVFFSQEVERLELLYWCEYTGESLHHGNTLSVKSERRIFNSDLIHEKQHSLRIKRKFFYDHCFRIQQGFCTYLIRQTTSRI